MNGLAQPLLPPTNVWRVRGTLRWQAIIVNSFSTLELVFSF
jgi:hypothetical protein